MKNEPIVENSKEMFSETTTNRKLEKCTSATTFFFNSFDDKSREVSVNDKQQIQHISSLNTHKLIQNKKDYGDFFFKLKLKMVCLLKTLELESRQFIELQKNSAEQLLEIFSSKIKQYIKNTQTRTKNLEKNLKLSEIRIIDLETEIKCLTSHMETTKKKLNRVNSYNQNQILKLLKQTESLEYDKNSGFQERKKLKSISDQQQSVIRLLESKVKSLQRDMGQKQDKIVSLQEKNVTLNRKAQQLQSKITDQTELLKDSILRSTQIIRNQKCQLQKNSSEIQGQKKSIISLKSRISELQQKQVKNNVNISMLTKTNQQLKSQICVKNQQFQKVTFYLREKQKQISIYHETVIQVESKISQNIKNLESLMLLLAKEKQQYQTKYTEKIEEQLKELTNKVISLNHQFERQMMIQEEEALINLQLVRQEEKIKYQKMMADYRQAHDFPVNNILSS